MTSADQRGPGTRAGRPLTITEQARRSQLIAATIELIAEHGYAGCSLQRIADAAGITKAAVIYHFDSKNAVLRAAYETVIESLTTRVEADITAASSAAGAVDAYLTSLIGHMADHPRHVRVLVEALGAAEAIGIEDGRHSAARWRPLAALIDAAVAAGEYHSEVDSRTLAIILSGAIDAVVAETLTDPTFDLTTAGTTLLTTLHRAADRSGSDGDSIP